MVEDRVKNFIFPKISRTTQNHYFDKIVYISKI